MIKLAPQAGFIKFSSDGKQSGDEGDGPPLTNDRYWDSAFVHLYITFSF